MTSRGPFVIAITAFLVGLSFATFAELRIFLPALLRGAVVTVKVATLSIAVFLVLSFALGVARAFFTGPVKWVATTVIEVFRGTSLLVILFWFFFVLPEFGVLLSPMTAAVISIGLNFGAYGAEVVRGALQSVPKGQHEAAVALNMTHSQWIRRVAVPQAFVVTIPGLTNLTVELIKATALVSAVTLTDITFASVQQNQLHFRTLEIFAITVMLYYCFAQFVSFASGALERRFSRHLIRRA